MLERLGGGLLRVRKRVPDGAPADLAASLELLASHALLAAPRCRVRAPAVLATGPGWIDVAWVEGETSLGTLERLLLERRFEAAHAELEDVLGLLEVFPRCEADVSAPGEFAAVFDPAGAWSPGGLEPCLVPGIYDFGLGNLVRPAAGGPRVLVNWEWVFPWPVPLAFAQYVVVRHSAEYLQTLLRALTSECLPGSSCSMTSSCPSAGRRRPGSRRSACGASSPTSAPSRTASTSCIARSTRTSSTRLRHASPGASTRTPRTSSRACAPS